MRQHRFRGRSAKAAVAMVTDQGWGQPRAVYCIQRIVTASGAASFSPWIKNRVFLPLSLNGIYYRIVSGKIIIYLLIIRGGILGGHQPEEREILTLPPSEEARRVARNRLQ